MAEVMKGVPLATPANRKRGSKYPFAEMVVDDFFFEPGRTTELFSSYVCRWGRRLGVTFRTRMITMRRPNKSSPWEECEADAKGAVEGVGVWRVA